MNTEPKSAIAVSKLKYLIAYLILFSFLTSISLVSTKDDCK